MWSIESYLTHADVLEEQVVSFCGYSVQAGNVLSREEKDLLEVACQYRDAKEIVSLRPKSSVLSDRDVTRVESARRAFQMPARISTLFLAPL